VSPGVRRPETKPNGSHPSNSENKNEQKYSLISDMVLWRVSGHMYCTFTLGTHVLYLYLILTITSDVSAVIAERFQKTNS
jgi:hypothetical protein